MSKNFRKNNVAESSFEKNYKQISESKKEILNQKYSCSICLEIIKHENPYLCYNCQKIFHNACLKHWNERKKQLNKTLSCPNCRNELPFEKWKVFINYDEIRTKDAQLLNQADKSFNSNEYIDKSMNLFQIVLNKLNIIHPKIESQINYKLKNLIEEFKYNLKCPSIDEISTVLIEELDLFEEFIASTKNDIKKEEFKNKNEINLKYMTEREGMHQIFGYQFALNNINNINLIINGKESPLVQEYYLKEGENNITLCIKNKLTNLSKMFDFCKTIYNIDELKYLNTEDVIDFSGMFQTTKISNIKALENWNTSKSESFKDMFFRCELLTNIKPLTNWDVSNAKNLSSLFSCCTNIVDISPIQNWNVSNCENLSNLFSCCESLSDISPIKNWNLSKVKNLHGLFSCCHRLSDISPIKNWNISKCENLGRLFNKCGNLENIISIKNWDISKCENLCSLFNECKLLADISPIKNWNVSNVKDYSYMFCLCSLIKDLKPLENWNVSKGTNFHMTFCGCGMSNLSPIKNWNVSNGKIFTYMFCDCFSLSDLKPVENWDVSNAIKFSFMFASLERLTDVSPLKNWNVSNGKDFNMMFSRCKSLKNGNVLQNWKFSKNSDFKSMFLDNASPNW